MNLAFIEVLQLDLDGCYPMRIDELNFCAADDVSSSRRTARAPSNILIRRTMVVNINCADLIG